MPGSVPTFAGLRGDESIEELRDEVAKMQKTMNHLLSHLSSKNVKEIGGYFVTPTDIVSKDGDVGISSEDVGADPVRFFAGGVDKETAPWRVLESGKMIATGALIQSSESSYPRVVIDPDNAVLSAEFSSTDNIRMIAEYLAANQPQLVFTNGSIDTTLGYFPFLGFAMLSGTNMSIGTSSDLKITATAGINMADSGTVTISDFSQLFSNGDSETLQQALDGKVTSGVQTGSAGASTYNGGIPIGTVLMVDGGGTVTWQGITTNAHTHTQN